MYNTSNIKIMEIYKQIAEIAPNTFGKFIKTYITINQAVQFTKLQDIEQIGYYLEYLHNNNLSIIVGEYNHIIYNATNGTKLIESNNTIKKELIQNYYEAIYSSFKYLEMPF